MNKLITFMMIALLGLVVLVTAGPTLVKLAGAITPLVLVVGIVVASLKVIWYLTRNRW